MAQRRRSVDSLKPAHFRKHPVWEFVSDDEPDETYVTPVKKLPVQTLDGRIIGAEVSLANGTRVWATLSNVDTRSPRETRIFLFLSVFLEEKWVHLARPFDFSRKKEGPKQLAKALGLPLEDVFPIRYDIRPWVTGSSGALRGKIEAEPREQPSRAARMAMIVKRGAALAAKSEGWW
jgi:hypothetical protein